MKRFIEKGARQRDALVDPSTDEQRLFSRTDKRLWSHDAFENDLKIKTINLSENDYAEVGAFFLMSEKKIVDINWSELYDSVYHERSPQLLIASIDGEISLDGAIVDLISCRERCQKLRVFLTSRSFRSDEFEIHRIAICDAMLKSPISSSRLERAVRAVLFDY